MACPEPVRFRCMRQNSGEFGVTPEELATILAPFLPGGSGTVKQIVRASTGAFTQLTTILPQDDSIPQITEGDQILSVVITPEDAANRILITGSAALTAATVTGCGLALFQNPGPGALVATRTRPDLTTIYIDNLLVQGDVLAGGTNPITFSLRSGPSIAGTIDVNGFGTRVFGGVSSTWITALEYEP